MAVALTKYRYTMKLHTSVWVQFKLLMTGGFLCFCSFNLKNMLSAYFAYITYFSTVVNFSCLSAIMLSSIFFSICLFHITLVLFSVCSSAVVFVWVCVRKRISVLHRIICSSCKSPNLCCCTFISVQETKSEEISFVLFLRCQNTEGMAC